MVAIVRRAAAATITAALYSCLPIPKMTSSGRLWSLLYVVFVAMVPVYGDDVYSTCPLPYWDNATTDVLARRSGYRFNDADISSIPWVHNDNGNVLNVPTVNCKHHAGGHPRRRVIVLLIDAISRPLVETKYPLLMNFSRQDHKAFHFKNHHTVGYNSEPNKKGLYAGMSAAKITTDAPKWLHKTFNQSGYTTIHADDVCEPTKVAGTLTYLMDTKPGDVMPDDRALCSPQKECREATCTATSSLEFVAQAVEQHAQCDLFVTLNPNHEHSTGFWYSKADLWVVRFLERVVGHNTIVVILSDHGIHYGRPFMSPLGTAYRTNPFLMVLWPKRMGGATSKALQRSTSASLTTPLNVYAFLDAIASGAPHSNTSLASPNFALNQTCKEAFIPSTECRCLHSGSCTFAAEQEAMVVLEDHLQAVTANPHCMPLHKSEFTVTLCTGDQTVHMAHLTRGRRQYQLKWDSEAAHLRGLVQTTVYKKDIDPCRSEVPNKLWSLCICNSTLSPDGASQAHNLNLTWIIVVGAAAVFLCIGLGLATSAGRSSYHQLVGAINGSLKGTALLAVGVSVLSVCMATIQPIVVQFSKVNGRVEYHMSSAVFYTEFLKLIVSIALWALMPPTSTSLPVTVSEDDKLCKCPPSPAAVSKVMGVMAYAVPAALYIAQNNLTIRAMSYLDPPTFQLWVTFRLIPAALLTRFVLKRSVSLVQWIALILLMIGMGVTTFKLSGSVDVSNESADDKFHGILLVLLNGCLSAMSGVTNEWLLKYQDTSLPMTLKNARMYAFGALLAIPTMRLPWTPGALHGFSPNAWAVVWTNAALGLSVSLVLRYADNLVKNFTSAAAVLFSALISAPLFGFQWTTPFVLGALIICCSFLLYFCVGAPAATKGPTVRQQDKAYALLASAEEPAFNTVITFGTFDVLHDGHIRILQRAAACGRRLVVGLSTDELNMSKKGRTPVYPYEQRKAILEAIRCVDHVFAEESLEKKEEYCREYGADLLVMGDDWAGKFDAVGVEVRYLERTPAISTTQTIETCKSI
jgi:glycerol-3-phosphate cytidylyltransferase